MVWLTKEFAVVAAVHQAFVTAERPYELVRRGVAISPGRVWHRMQCIRRETGHALLDAFNCGKLKAFFYTNPVLFQRLTSGLAWRLRTENLGISVSDELLKHAESCRCLHTAASALICTRLLKVFDVYLDYPEPVLESAGIFDILTAPPLEEKPVRLDLAPHIRYFLRNRKDTGRGGHDRS